MVRFDQPCVQVSGAVEYFREHMAVGDYLTQGGKSQMVWAGAGARRLGLDGQCLMDHFENLCRGLHPTTGEKLMVRDKGIRRRVCFFAQVSPPKDVSLLYLVGGDQRIGAWWQEAVAETIREIEATTATRVRRAGANQDRVTGNMIAAVVTHDASRSLDPQLHTHLCLMNVTFDEAEGRWKSVQPSAFYRHQGYFREVCYSHLAKRMIVAGYKLDSLRSLGFNVVGVPADLRQRFSKRRERILKEASLLGASSQDALQSIAGESRAAKQAATEVELREAWIKEAGEGIAALRATIAQAYGRRKAAALFGSRDALLSAEAHVFERRSVVDVRALLREALVAGRGAATLEGIRKAMHGREAAGDLLRIQDDVALRDGLEAEQEFTGWAHSERNRHKALGRVPALAQFGEDQKRAVRAILSSTDGVVILQGDAGTGKTTCLKAIVAGIESAGEQVFGCAPSSGATDVLRQELTAAADTLQKLLASDDLKRKVRGRILVLDEAGLVSVREMRDLCRLAARNQNRLLLVGDTKQHHSVEAGDALRCLQEHARIPIHRLTEIRRQQDPAYRKAVARLAAGDAFGAFNRFDKLGAVREVAGTSAMVSLAAEDYVRTVREGKSCLAISPVWSELHAFTDAVRKRLRAVGLLGAEERCIAAVHSLKWTREERRRATSYQPGDVLIFNRAAAGFSKHEVATVQRRDGLMLVVHDDSGRERRLDPRRTSGFEVGITKETPVTAGDRLLVRANLKAAGLRNGDIVEVSRVTRVDGIALKDGRTIPPWFREFSHGYGATSHASQGKTVDRGILLMGMEGIAAGSLKQAYVSNSRFRQSQIIYAADKEAARDAMMKPSDRKLVTEMLEATEEVPRPSFRARWIERLGSTLRTAA